MARSTPAKPWASTNASARSKARRIGPVDMIVESRITLMTRSAIAAISREPMVLTVPDTNGRYYLLPMIDAWTNVFATPGARTTEAARAVQPSNWLRVGHASDIDGARHSSRAFKNAWEFGARPRRATRAVNGLDIS